MKAEVRGRESGSRDRSAVGRKPLRALIVFGTRPEAIKLAPVIKELERYPAGFEPVVAVTGQHRKMLDQVLSVFDIKPDYDLKIMRPGQSPADIVARTLGGMEPLLELVKPDIMLVQGDTTTAFASALAAFHRRIPVGHVEAGLRTGDRYAPFPEEMNRRLITRLADLHFAPTEQARKALLQEGISPRAVFVTGNTVVDALLAARARARTRRVAVLDRMAQGRRMILVTAHRRESFGEGFERICRALALILRRNPDVEIVYPVHLNPNVRGPVRSTLGGLERLHLIEPLEYLQFVRLMERAYLILTDSGGIQEEAPALGKPALVMRDRTERPEAIEAGTAVLVGTDVEKITTTTGELLDSAQKYARMARAVNPFGDGRAARRIARVLERWARRRPLSASCS